MKLRLSARQGALAALAAAGLMLSVVPADASAQAPAVPELDWKPCAESFECATIPVPLDYRKPQGKKISLAMMRLPATDRVNRIGSLFVLPGGPGLPGNDFLPDAPPGALAALDRFDVVTWDPRGTGDSRPLVDCGVAGANEPQFDRSDTVDRAQVEAKLRAYAKACELRNKDLLPHLSTATTARDVDLMRRAVGDEKLSAIGISYGSAIGATYVSMFPGRARAMLLSNVMDTDAYVNKPVELWREQAASFEDVLGRFFLRCAAAGDRCGFGGDDPETALDHLLAKLDRAPLTSTDPRNPRPLTGNLVREIAFSTMYSPNLWQRFARALAAAESGDPDPMFEHFRATRDQLGFGFTTDAYIAVLGVDQRFPRQPVSAYLDALQHSEGLFEHFWWLSGLDDLKVSLWRAEDRDAFRGQLRNPSSAAPVLLIGGTHDAATPYTWAERTTADLGNARLLTFESDSHSGLLSGNFCLLGHALPYLFDGKTLPPEGTVCVDDRDPFPAE